jgi:hypothetical protein
MRNPKRLRGAARLATEVYEKSASCCDNESLGEHAAHSIQKYEAGNDVAALASRAWDTIPCPRQKPAGKAGHRVHTIAYRGIRARLFLAYACGLQTSINSEITYWLLGTEAPTKR